MQHSSARARIQSLLTEISPSTSSPSDSLTICLRESGVVYLSPNTEAGKAFMNGIRPVGYTVAIKTRPPSVTALLAYSPDNMHVILLEDASVLRVVDSAACLVEAKDHKAAILRDEKALVIWSIGSCETIGAQLHEWERRIDQTVFHTEREMKKQHQGTISPAILFASPRLWTPTLDQYHTLTPFPSYPHDCVDPPSSLADPSFGYLGDDLPSLLELGSLHGLECNGHCNPYSFPASPFSTPSLSPYTSPSSSPYASQSKTLVDRDPNNPNDSPFFTGTICLADISPAPPFFDNTDLPEDEDIAASDSSSPTSPVAALEALPSPRKIKALPSRPLSSSSSPFLSLSSPLPMASKSAKTLPKLDLPTPSGTSSTTPLFASLSLQSSPRPGIKRKSPSPPAVSSAVRRSPLPDSLTSSPLPTSKASPPECDDSDSDLSELDDKSDCSNEDEDFSDSDDDFDDTPPVKKIRVVAPKSSAGKARVVTRRRGGKPSPGKKRKFSCDSCGTKFTRDADRARHQKTACSKESKELKEHACTKCSSAFSRIDALKRHYKHSHRLHG
ncbi:hypothetical protein BC835DRAFT_609478 [Cytidiella melzeri]|nr:hypothetical protein BC835DRAFT_609478 [Cytidiella melzeri]